MPISINPTTGETIKRIAEHDEHYVESALENAALCFDEWRHSPFEQREELLHTVADQLDTRRDDLAALAVEEMGKTIVQAKSEVEKCAWVCRYYADNGKDMLAETELESDASKAWIAYQPLGTILAVMPWNFPFWQVFRFAAPTLMAGNTALLKHASSVSQCAMAIEELFKDAGAPQGIFSTLLIGSDMVEKIINDNRVSGVSLTGSEGAGRAVAAAAGKAIKPSLLELGGSDPFVIMSSADLDAAIKTAVKARTINNGQSCIAAKRFIVQTDVYNEFLSRFESAFRALAVGDPMDEGTDIGPMQSESARDTLLEQISSLTDDGANLVCGGKTIEREGFFLEPTILSDIPKDAKVRDDEIFGPIALVFKVDNLDDALAIANETPFGLGSSFWSRDKDEITRAVERLEAGAVFVNQMVASDPRLPFGGIKNSGYGRELAENGIKAFVNVKTISIK